VWLAGKEGNHVQGAHFERQKCFILKIFHSNVGERAQNRSKPEIKV
jgi:hypothetical protein